MGEPWSPGSACRSVLSLSSLSALDGQVRETEQGPQLSMGLGIRKGKMNGVSELAPLRKEKGCTGREVHQSHGEGQDAGGEDLSCPLRGFHENPRTSPLLRPPCKLAWLSSPREAREGPERLWGRWRLSLKSSSAPEDTG